MASLAEEIGQKLLEKAAFLAVAESCTGGLITKLVTDVAGSSSWFDRGLVTYSNLAKQDLLGVSPETLKSFGAVSRETAEAMAKGLLVMTPADFGLAVTGIAGPGGGSPEKPVGLVWIAWARRGGPIDSKYFQFGGSREQVRSAAADAALNGLLEQLGNSQ